MALRYVLADWPIIVAYFHLFGLVAVMVIRWSERVGWDAAYRLALAGGAVLAYAWHCFSEKPVIGSEGKIDLVGNAVFSLGAVVLPVVASRTVLRGQDETSSAAEHGLPIVPPAKPLG